MIIPFENYNSGSGFTLCHTFRVSRKQCSFSLGYTRFLVSDLIDRDRYTTFRLGRHTTKNKQ